MRTCDGAHRRLSPSTRTRALKKPPAAPTPAVSLEQLGSLLARLEVIDKRISKLIGHHFRDVNAELYQVLKKAGLLDVEVSADFGEPSS